MNKVTHITPHIAVTGALQPADFAEIAAAGFKSVLSNLPDGESAAYPTSPQEAELAARPGLGFRHIPTTKADLFTERVVDGVGDPRCASCRVRCWRIARRVCAPRSPGRRPRRATNRLNA